MPKKKGTRVLVIPDSHANPDLDNDRFYRLGKAAQGWGLDGVLSIGDFADMESLNRHKKVIEKEGARIRRCLDASIDALDRLETGLGPKSKSMFGAITLGNHEHYIDRYSQEIPEMLGMFSTRDLQFEDYGWDVIPFEETHFIDGVGFCHYFRGPNGKPVSSGVQTNTSVAKKIARMAGHSMVVGHSHTFDETSVCTNMRTGKHSQAMVCGYFGHPDYPRKKGSWAKGFHQHWVYQVVVLDIKDGNWKSTQIGLEDL